MKIAITGTIGSGKSVVSEYIRSKGFDVFDADKVNAELLIKDSYAYNQIKYLYPEVIDNDELNKKKLADLMFNNSNVKSKVESIMHPLILKKLLLASLKNEIFFAEIPLLFEFGWDAMFDKCILVACNDEVSIKRLIDKGFDEKSAKLRLNSQMSVQDKSKRADEIIYNNGSLSELYEAVDRVLNKYVR